METLTGSSQPTTADGNLQCQLCRARPRQLLGENLHGSDPATLVSLRVRLQHLGAIFRWKISAVRSEERTEGGKGGRARSGHSAG